MSELTNQEWVALIRKSANYLRSGLSMGIGQSYMYALRDTRFDLYTEITGTPIDPSHTDTRLVLFYDFLLKSDD